MQDKNISPSMFIGIQGDGYISFGSGQPDLPPPERVFKILPNYRQFKYGLIQGQENLRKALSKQKQFENSDKDSFVITNGASEALDLTFRAILKPREKILLHKPYYYSWFFRPHLLLQLDKLFYIRYYSIKACAAAD